MVLLLLITEDPLHRKVEVIMNNKNNIIIINNS